jgi:hypothetical protein
MDSERFIRTSGILCLIGGSIVATGAAVAGLFPAAVPTTAASYPLTPEVFRFTQVVWAACHVLVVLGTLGLVRSDAAGASGLGRVGGWLALVAMALIPPLELAYVPFATGTVESGPAMVLGSTLGLTAIVAGLGFVLAGIAVLRARRWEGWRRFSPLLCGVIVFVLITPVATIRPDLFTWPLVAWNLGLALLGLALAQEYPGLPRAALSSAAS